jgi:hypothetical protein
MSYNKNDRCVASTRELTFTHQAGQDWVFDPARTYEQKDGWWKPTGLWLSVDGDWERWLVASDYLDDESWGAVTVEFMLDVDRCLVLSSVEDIDRFDRDYVVPNTPTDPGLFEARNHINWAPLTSQYAGIVIAPYQNARRHGHDASGWYDTWDVASACVWDLSAVTLLPEPL